MKPYATDKCNQSHKSILYRNEIISANDSIVPPVDSGRFRTQAGGLFGTTQVTVAIVDGRRRDRINFDEGDKYILIHVVDLVVVVGSSRCILLPTPI